MRIGLGSSVLCIALLLGACSSSVQDEGGDERPITALCADLEQAIGSMESIWNAGDLDAANIQLARDTNSLLSGVARDLPNDAPDETAVLLNAAGGLIGALGDSFEAEDQRAAFVEEAGQFQTTMEETDWDPAEEWIASSCGLDTYGIQIRMRSDDRATATTTQSSDDTTTTTSSEDDN